MHRYNFDIPATLRLRELIADYGRMGGLEEMTVQQRGQRLNEFVAELLRCWGLGRVEANVRSIGEIDVAFAIDDTRFILEAKWEQAPVSFDPIAKLSRRITQRLTGTRGVFLSMSGYTAGAIGDMLRGQQPDILLLDRSHLEAMLSGLFSPSGPVHRAAGPRLLPRRGPGAAHRPVDARRQVALASADNQLSGRRLPASHHRNGPGHPRRSRAARHPAAGHRN